jgi:hypothetical protein
VLGYNRLVPADFCDCVEDLDGALFSHTTPGWRLKIFRERSIEDIKEEEQGISKIRDPAL